MNWLTGHTSMDETLWDNIGGHRHTLSNQLNDEKAGCRRVERERDIDFFIFMCLEELEGSRDNKLNLFHVKNSRAVNFLTLEICAEVGM